MRDKEAEPHYPRHYDHNKQDHFRPLSFLFHLVPAPASINRKMHSSTKAPTQTPSQNQYKPMGVSRRELQSNEQNVLASGSDFEPKVVTHRTAFRRIRSQRRYPR